MRILVIAMFFAAAASQQAPPVAYSDAFAGRYGEASDTPLEFPEATPLEPAVVVRSRLGASSATMLRTDGVKIPYEQAEAHITVTSELGAPSYLRMRGFRSVTTSWVGERLLFIYRDVGHVAAVEEIYDVVDRKWLLQQSVHYRWP